MTQRTSTAATVEEALDALAGGARPVAGGTDLVVGARQGKAPLPGELVAIHRARRAARASPTVGGGLRLGALATHAELVAHRGRPRAVHRARGRVGDRRLARDARPGDDRRQPDERLAGDGDRRPADLLRRHRDAALGERRERRSRSPSCSPAPARRPSPSRASSCRRSTCRARRRGTGSGYVRLEYRRQMEIAVVGATAVVTLDGGTVSDARVAITALAPTIRRVPGGRGGARRHRRRRRRGRRGGARRGRGGGADLGRPRLGAVPPRDGRA